MNKLHFALTAAAALAISACGGGDEADENVENGIAQNEQINALADDAANRAEMEALGTQQQQLQAEEPANESENAAADVEPTEDPDENVTGM